jgi:transcriptional regulator with XRE-family HTH domain
MEKSTISMITVESIYKSIAQRVRARRLEKNLTQKAFAKRAGVGYDAYRSFESTGDTSLRNLILIAFVLGDEDVFESMFTKKSYQSIDEVIRQKESKTRKRASSK